LISDCISDTSSSTTHFSGRERDIFPALTSHLSPCFHFLITYISLPFPATLEGLCFGNIVPLSLAFPLWIFLEWPLAWSARARIPEIPFHGQLSNFVLEFLITNPWAHPSFRKLFVPREGGFSIFRPLYFRWVDVSPKKRIRNPWAELFTTILWTFVIFW